MVPSFRAVDLAYHLVHKGSIQVVYDETDGLLMGGETFCGNVARGGPRDPLGNIYRSFSPAHVSRRDADWYVDADWAQPSHVKDMKTQEWTIVVCFASFLITLIAQSPVRLIGQKLRSHHRL